jgi:hypothetical protein
MVYAVTIPNAHNTSAITKIVQSIFRIPSKTKQCMSGSKRTRDDGRPLAPVDFENREVKDEKTCNSDFGFGSAAVSGI